MFNCRKTRLLHKTAANVTVWLKPQHPKKQKWDDEEVQWEARDLSRDKSHLSAFSHSHAATALQAIAHPELHIQGWFNPLGRAPAPAEVSPTTLGGCKAVLPAPPRRFFTHGSRSPFISMSFNHPSSAPELSGELGKCQTCCSSGRVQGSTIVQALLLSETGRTKIKSHPRTHLYC